MQRYDFYFNGHLICSSTVMKQFIPMVTNFLAQEFAHYDTGTMIDCIIEVLDAISSLQPDTSVEDFPWFGEYKFVWVNEVQNG